MDKTFYSLIFKQVVVGARYIQIFFLIALLQGRLYWKYNNYTMYYLYIIGINNIAVINNIYGKLQGLILLSKFSWAGERNL